ncbi:hypothetical protein GCM10020331_060130 [Ectobacillus funiculus]
MVRFWIKHIAQLLFVILFTATFTFLLLRLAPGDPAYILLTKNDIPASEEALSAVRKELGLTESLGSQYVQWIMDIFLRGSGESPMFLRNLY